MDRIEDLNQLLAEGRISPRMAIAEAARLGRDAEIILPCEAPGCNARVPLPQVYSLAAVYRCYPGAIPGRYQCRDEQHWTCSHEHALIALEQCAREHVTRDVIEPARSERQQQP